MLFGEQKRNTGTSLSRGSFRAQHCAHEHREEERGAIPQAPRAVRLHLERADLKHDRPLFELVLHERRKPGVVQAAFGEKHNVQPAQDKVQ